MAARTDSERPSEPAVAPAPAVLVLTVVVLAAFLVLAASP
jgi:hypothetical protein